VKRILIARLLLVTLVGLSLVPLARMIGDWIRYADLVIESTDNDPARAFDWVHWDDRDGQITAVYVFPKGSGYDAGIRTGDILYEFDFSQYFTSDELKRVVEGIPPDQTRTYTLLRGTELLRVEVRFSHYPIFLYPLGSTLWSASIWGFVLGAFIHLLALIIVIPLSGRSRSALLSLLLIATSSLWVFGNLARILLVTLFGPEVVFGVLEPVFTALTLGSLAGWIGFPILLVYKMIWDIEPLNRYSLTMGLVMSLPPVLLGMFAVLAVAAPSVVAPVTLESLIAPILFYVCCYVAGAAGLSLSFGSEPLDSEDQDLDEPRWSRAGSSAVATVAFIAALSVFGVVPIFGVITDDVAGWIVIAAQLLSVAPVLLISFATLKYGKVDQVLRRSLTYVTALGLFFFVFVGGLSWLLEDLQRLGAPVVLVAGLYAVILLFLFDRGWRLIGPSALEFFRTDRQKARQQIVDFSESMRSFVGLQELLDRCAETVHNVLGSSHACIHLETSDGSTSATYPNRPAELTREIVEGVWPHFSVRPELWARNPELNLATVPTDVSLTLLSSGAALAVPLVDEGKLSGLFVLGRKTGRRAVYTLEDVESIRTLCTHLALAIERLNHLEREKELIRKTAESQLTALRAQINPHFLFNTLNAIAALIEEKPEDAEKTVEHLSAIFRHTLEAGGESFVTLERELALVGRYLAIEQVRFGSRLQVDMATDDDLTRQLVPAFSIQTLVENAVKHGVSKMREGGLVRISARTVTVGRPFDDGNEDEDGDEFAEIEILDSGVGIPSLFGLGPVSSNDVDFLGLGLTNVTTRLQKLYDRDDLLSFECRPGEGTRVTMRLPIPTSREASQTGSNQNDT
jgi:two-component system LytT family sensor kinase